MDAWQKQASLPEKSQVRGSDILFHRGEERLPWATRPYSDTLFHCFLELGAESATPAH